MSWVSGVAVTVYAPRIGTYGGSLERTIHVAALRAGASRMPVVVGGESCRGCS
jgi:hypothetical protein